MWHEAFLRTRNEYYREFKPLAGMDRHKVYLALVRFSVVKVVAAKKGNAVKVGIKACVVVLGVVFPLFHALDKAFYVHVLESGCLFALGVFCN